MTAAEDIALTQPASWEKGGMAFFRLARGLVVELSVLLRLVLNGQDVAGKAGPLKGYRPIAVFRLSGRKPGTGQAVP